MRILALETDIEKIKARFCHEGEDIVLFTYYHGLSFFFAILREIVITVVLLIAMIVSVIFEWPLIWVIPILLFLWLGFVFFNVLKAYIDWSYDFLIVTTDKIILVDQTSVFKQEIMPMHIENIGGVSTFTQFMNIFPFGGIVLHLKEGKGGEDITLNYVPRAQQVASVISDVVTTYQRKEAVPESTMPAPGEPPHYIDPVQSPIQPEHPDVRT